MAKLVTGDSTPNFLKYIEKPVHMAGTIQKMHTDENGKLVLGPSYEASSIWPEIDMTGIVDLGPEVFYSAYDKITDDTITKVDLSSLTSITGDKCFTYAFRSDASTPGCYNISEIDMSNVTRIANSGTTNYGPCEGAFKYFHNNTPGVPVTLKFDNLEYIEGNYATNEMFQYAKDITSIYMPKLKEITGNTAVAGSMFEYCSDLITVDLPEVISISNTSSMFGTCQCLQTAYLPKIESLITCNNFFVNDTLLQTLDLSKLNYIQNSYSLCKGCTNLRNISFGNQGSGVHLIQQYHSAPTIATAITYGIFEDCTNLETIDLSNIIEIGLRGAPGIFNGCLSLGSQGLTFDKLEVVGADGLNTGFKNCNSLTSISFPKLWQVGDFSFRFAFMNCYNLTDIYFPALSDFWDNFLTKAFDGCDGVTLHFSSTLAGSAEIEAALSLAGGSNITAVFDQPALPTITFKVKTDSLTTTCIYYKNKLLYGTNHEIFEQYALVTFDPVINLGSDKIYICRTAGDYGAFIAATEDWNGEGDELEIDLRLASQTHTYISTQWQSNEPVASINLTLKTDTDITLGTYMHEGWPIVGETSGPLGYYTPDFVLETTWTPQTAGYLPTSLTLDYTEVTPGTTLTPTLTFNYATTLYEFDTTNFGSYLSVEPNGIWDIVNLQDYTTGEYEDVLQIHNNTGVTKEWMTSQGIELTLPSNMNTFIFTMMCNADSENNYDFGYIALRNEVSDIPATKSVAQGGSVKNWSDTLGIRLMKDSNNHNGCNITEWSATVTRDQLESILSTGPYYLQFGFAQDSSTVKFTNSFYIKSVKIVGY